MNKIKTGSYAGIAGSVIFFILFILAAGSYSNYNISTNHLSDLGVSGVSSVLFNSALILTGLLTILLGLGLAKFFSGAGRWGGRMLIVSSIFLIATGVFPEQYEPIHTIVSDIFFVLGAIAILLWGIELKRKSKIAYLAILSGILPFIFVAIDLPVIEHMAVFGMMLAGLVIGVYILKIHGPKDF